MENFHTHNGIDSPQLPARSIEKLPQTAIADPSGGATVDTEARATIVLILDMLRDVEIIRE